MEELSGIVSSDAEDAAGEVGAEGVADIGKGVRVVHQEGIENTHAEEECRLEDGDHQPACQQPAAPEERAVKECPGRESQHVPSHQQNHAPAAAVQLGHAPDHKRRRHRRLHQRYRPGGRRHVHAETALVHFEAHLGDRWMERIFSCIFRTLLQISWVRLHFCTCRNFLFVAFRVRLLCYASGQVLSLLFPSITILSPLLSELSLGRQHLPESEKHMCDFHLSEI